MPGPQPDDRSDRHARPATSFRPEPTEYATAVELLDARHRGIGDYLRACLLRLASDPDGVLRELAPYWPQPRPKGNPRHRAGRASARQESGSPGGH